MRHFSDFLSHNDKEVRRRLYILHEVLTAAGFRVDKHAAGDDPHLFVHKPTELDRRLETLPFGGIRIYARGKNMICYRVQNETTTKPYGDTYRLNVNDMLRDLLQHTDDEKKLAHGLVRAILLELKAFFVRSAQAEVAQTPDERTTPMGSIVVGGAGLDYANQVLSVRRS